MTAERSDTDAERAEHCNEGVVLLTRTEERVPEGHSPLRPASGERRDPDRAVSDVDPLPRL